jgi:hypothetical protein
MRRSTVLRILPQLVFPALSLSRFFLFGFGIRSAMTLGIMTFSIMTLSITLFSIAIFSITIFSINNI